MVYFFSVHICAGQQQFKTLPASEFESLIQQWKVTEQPIAVHFWATWCVPCLQELKELSTLPEIEQLGKRIHFISLDFSRDSVKVKSYIQKNAWMQHVFLLDYKNDVRWMEQVQPSWQGNIPATLFLYPLAKKEFFSGSLHAAEWLERLHFIDVKANSP